MTQGLPMTLTSHISIEVYAELASLQVEVNPGCRRFINTTPCVTMLTVIFITDAGHPDRASW